MTEAHCPLVFQTLVDVTHPVLLSVSASTRSVWKHLRVLSLCVLLFAASSAQSLFLLSAFKEDDDGGTTGMGFWALIVVSTSLLTAIQVRS